MAKKQRKNPVKLKHKAAFIWVYELRQTIDKHIPEWIEFKQLQSIHFLFPCPFTFIFCFNCIKLISYDTFHCPYRRSLFNIDIIHSAENGKSILRAVLKMSFVDNLTFHFSDKSLAKERFICPTLPILIFSLFPALRQL